MLLELGVSRLGGQRSETLSRALAMAVTIAIMAASPLWPQPSHADTPYITVASTTSTQNSGLFRQILPKFTEASGIEVRVVAVGTGAALRLARAGDADVLLVHHKSSEEKFVADGYGVRRFPVMFNDFVIVGPGDDPARITGGRDAAMAMATIAQVKTAFVSRGDDSGTHKRELELWAAAGIDPSAASGTWYRETGSGMGATLNVGAALGAHALTDRGTWLGFANKRGLVVLVEGDPRLRNEYGVILVSKQRHGHVKAAEGQSFIDWLISAAGGAAINGFRIGGERLFTAIE